MIDASHQAHEQRRLLKSYKLLIQLLLEELQTSLAGIQAFLLRDIIYAILRILASFSNVKGDNNLRLILLCDLLNDVCNTATAVCPEVRSFVCNFRFHYWFQQTVFCEYGIKFYNKF